MNALLEDRITVPQADLDEFCRRNHIRKLSFFGSVLRDDFRPESDIDILVEFEPGHVPGYFRLSAMESELSGLFGRKVDLRTPGEISDYYLDRVVASSEVRYESA
jgi:predicted nucleotidyltransferase